MLAAGERDHMILRAAMILECVDSQCSIITVKMFQPCLGCICSEDSIVPTSCSAFRVEMALTLLVLVASVASVQRFLLYPTSCS